MSKTHRLVTTLAATLIAIGVLAAVLTGGSGYSAVLAAPDAPLVEAHKSVSAEEVAPGQTVGYTIVLTNTSGSMLNSVTVVDEHHTDLSFVEDSQVVAPMGSGLIDSYDADTITFTLLSMAADKVVTITFDATLANGATPESEIGNVARVYSGTTEVAATAPVSFTVSPTPDLQIFAPESGAVITDRPEQTLEISGRAWAQFDPAPFPAVPVIDEIDNFGGGGSYSVEWTPVTDATNYVLQESTDQDFSSTTAYPVAAPTASQFIAGKSPGTYYYRVAAYNAAGRPSRWSNVESVTVTSAARTALAEPDDAALTINAVDMPADTTINVEVSTDGGSDWSAASATMNPGGWWDWTYDWTLPEGDDVANPIMARASYSAGGDYGTDTVTVTLQNSTIFVYMPIIFKRWPPVPYAPTLNNITTINNDDRDFRVSWSYSGSSSVPAPTGYQLQQASDADFTQDVTDYNLGTSPTSKDFTDMAGGTYYFRVRGQNQHGYGSWSGVKSTSVVATSYEFDSDADKVWALTRSDDGAGDLLEPVFRDGLMYHLVFGRYDFSIMSPMEEGPEAPYTIYAKADFIDSESIGDGDYAPREGMTYGIIFGGNGGTPCPVDRSDDGGCLDHYYRILVIWTGDDLKWQLKRIDSHDSDGKGRGDTLVDWNTVNDANPLGWNEWRIEVETDGDIKVFVNDVHEATGNDDDYLTDGYFGTYMETSPHGEAGTKWEYFRVESN